MLTYRCYGRHGQGKQERTDGREAVASYLLIEEAVCPICKSRDHVEVESRLYWCTHCRIPLYEKNCSLCHAPAEEFVRDCRIVFPEEKRLLELLMEAEPGTYDHSSVERGRHLLCGWAEAAVRDHEAVRGTDPSGSTEDTGGIPKY